MTLGEINGSGFFASPFQTQLMAELSSFNDDRRAWPEDAPRLSDSAQRSAFKSFPIIY